MENEYEYSVGIYGVKGKKKGCKTRKPLTNGATWTKFILNENKPVIQCPEVFL
jgi:hypothetical protein